MNVRKQAKTNMSFYWDHRARFHRSQTDYGKCWKSRRPRLGDFQPIDWKDKEERGKEWSVGGKLKNLLRCVLSSH